MIIFQNNYLFFAIVLNMKLKFMIYKKINFYKSRKNLTLKKFKKL